MFLFVYKIQVGIKPIYKIIICNFYYNFISDFQTTINSSPDAYHQPDATTINSSPDAYPQPNPVTSGHETEVKEVLSDDRLLTEIRQFTNAQRQGK
jgi:hypothetical protein